MDDNVHKLCELTKATYAMSDWALGTNNYENNPLYEKLEQMMKVVEQIRLDDVCKRMIESHTDLSHIGYTVDDSGFLMNSSQLNDLRKLVNRDFNMRLKFKGF